MEYLLSDKELRQMMPRNENNKVCREYQKQIKALKASVDRLQSEYIIQTGKISKYSETEELISLLANMQKNAGRLLLSLVEKQGGMVTDDFPLCYRNEKGDIVEEVMQHIKSCGAVFIESGGTIHVEKLIPDALFALLRRIYTEESPQENWKPINNDTP